MSDPDAPNEAAVCTDTDAKLAANAMALESPLLYYLGSYHQIGLDQIVNILLYHY
jgi:hypothetical protein